MAAKPLSARKLAELTGEKTVAVEKALTELARLLDESAGGLRLARSGNDSELVTAPENAKLVQDFLREEMTGELTKPSLETLTIIAYRGPVSKAEIEQIRGVNCSLILRNLMIRGLIEAEEDKKLSLTKYRVTLDFLRHLGLTQISKLPDYERLSNADILSKLLETQPTKDNAPSI